MEILVGPDISKFGSPDGFTSKSPINGLPPLTKNHMKNYALSQFTHSIHAIRMTGSIQPFINLPFWTFWNGPMLSNSFKLIGAFPPFEGGNDENCGGSDGSNANP